MEVITDINKMKEIVKHLKKEQKTIGFVPTMGYLHEGHISLMKCSKKENDITIVSIYVNPTQFGENEDYDKYPRDIERDKNICKKENIDYLFIPNDKQMYPEGYSTYIIMETLTNKLCGAYRPNHFKGVLTIVNKFFNIIKPDKAYFGKKDYQQYIIIKKMVHDLNMDISVIGCPIVREKDGLAMSSRNKYLSNEERKSALYIYKALKKAKEEFYKGEKSPSVLKEIIKNTISNKKHIKEIQYIEIIDPQTLEEKQTVKAGDIIAIAVFVGTTRLIDNIEI